MRRLKAGGSLLVVALAWPVQAAERKVAPTLYECPPDAPDHAIDRDGLQDACAKRVAPACPAGTALRPDAVGTADRCVPPPRRPPARPRRPAAKAPVTLPAGPAVVAPVAPTCPPDLPLVARTGGDVCERTAAPICPKDFVETATAGEDRCVYAPQQKKKAR